VVDVDFVKALREGEFAFSRAIASGADECCAPAFEGGGLFHLHRGRWREDFDGEAVANWHRWISCLDGFAADASHFPGSIGQGLDHDGGADSANECSIESD